jgi:hypothetical protein
MKRPNREINIFNLSMLDTMTGALGAVMIIMILLLTQKIGGESMSCQDVKSELIETSGTLSSTADELERTRAELQRYREARPESVEKISALTRIINATVENVRGTLKKISDLKTQIMQTQDDELVSFKIPHRIVMVVDLSGSMASENNRYNEDRLSQVKAALKMFIAAMDERYQIDVVFFPAFRENVDSQQCPGFTVKPDPEPACGKYERRDDAYDDASLACYKYGYFEGGLKKISTEEDKTSFYRRIACLKPYHDTPTETAMEFILRGGKYREAEGIILFSDGQPDAIRKKKMGRDALLKKIKDMNDSNKKIFTVGIGAEFRNREDNEAVDFLKKLAEQNNGFYIGF